ncbi:MAG: hypothetical protein WCI51_01085 [Lentisphaerota bacterium]
MGMSEYKRIPIDDEIIQSLKKYIEEYGIGKLSEACNVSEVSIRSWITGKTSRINADSWQKVSEIIKVERNLVENIDEWQIDDRSEIKQFIEARNWSGNSLPEALAYFAKHSNELCTDSEFEDWNLNSNRLSLETPVLCGFRYKSREGYLIRYVAIKEAFQHKSTLNYYFSGYDYVRNAKRTFMVDNIGGVIFYKGSFCPKSKWIKDILEKQDWQEWKIVKNNSSQAEAAVPVPKQPDPGRTKKCLKCSADIPEPAKKCPHCKTVQFKPSCVGIGCFIIILLFVIFFIIGLLAGPHR